MDCYKHGRITYLDWFKLLTVSKDWLVDVKQQIGIVLSKKYKSLGEAFTAITSGDKKLTLPAFERWSKANHVLSGFMPNEDIVKHIFTSLDLHKKGYLLEADFVALFAGYDWKAEHTREFLDFLTVKFPSALEAFRFMAGFGR